MSEYALEMKNISKSFPGVKALNDISIRVRKGHVHAIVGENGAGKSTLMKVLNGVYRADTGHIYLEGKEVDITDINVAQDLGISLIFQESNLIPQLSVAENFFLGHPLKTKLGLVNWAGMKQAVRDIFTRLDYYVDPDETIRNISAADKQMVEIARAISKNAKIIVMDEPTSSLTTVETGKLFNIINDLRKQQITVLFISHKLDEIFTIADMITVQRDGEIVHTAPVAEMTHNKIIELMVGRSVNKEFPRREPHIGEVVLEARNVSRRGILHNVDLILHKGEILGLAGLVGAGRTELAEAIFGAAKMSEGELFLHGKKVSINTTQQATAASIGMLPEERKETGLALTASVKNNIVIAKLRKVCSGKIWLNPEKEKRAAERYVKALNVRTPSINQTAVSLSGGNQQKVVLAKWLFSDADILIMDEPTRGIDIGAKQEIYSIMNELVQSGKSIILISSELTEELGMCDRIIVLHEGHKKGELTRDQFSSEAIMKMAVS